MRPRTLMAIAAVALSIAAGCSKDEATSVATGTTTGAGMTIEFSSTRPPATGDNAVEVSVKKDGVAVNDAVVTARFSMPAMPSMNMPEMHSETTLEPAGDGRYRGTGQLSMAGTWTVLVRVTRGNEELGSSLLSIVAK